MNDDKKEFKPDGKYQPKDSMLLRAKLRLKMAKRKKMNESELFNNVKPGDTVHYRTPQGVTAKGKVVMNRGTHLVLNRGRGSPQVVNDKNYVKHERGGKVVGALLSRLKEASWQGANDPYNWDPVMRKLVFDAASKKNRAEQKKKGQPVPHELDTGRTLKSKPQPFRRGVKESAIVGGLIGLAAAGAGAYGAAKNTPLSGKNATVKNYLKNFAKGMVGVGLRDKKKAVKEDAKDLEGRSSRVSKTKHAKKKLHELNTGTLASYVSKAIADRKKQQGMADMARRIHTPERAAYFVDKTTKKADKRSKGIKTAVAKIAKAYEETEVNEVSAPGKEAWIKANKQRFIARYGKEKGLRVLYAKAWKDSKTNEARESEWQANMQLAGRVTKTDPGHYLVRDGRRLSGPHSPEDAVREYKKMGDSKGVKIVHVKETHHFDVTFELISEDKVKTAAKKAVDLKKKAKGNKHVDTEPKLDLQDKGTGGPMETNHGDENAKI